MSGRVRVSPRTRANRFPIVDRESAATRRTKTVYETSCKMASKKQPRFVRSGACKASLKMLNRGKRRVSARSAPRFHRCFDLYVSIITCRRRREVASRVDVSAIGRTHEET